VHHAQYSTITRTHNGITHFLTLQVTTFVFGFCVKQLKSHVKKAADNKDGVY